jgi:DNA invertase Pin-like site-specific DNA recombinase
MADTQPTEEIHFRQPLDEVVRKPTQLKRAALYMRVSTKGHSQNTETQALALREYAAHRGFNIVQEYRDEGFSGSKDSRPALDRLM